MQQHDKIGQLSRDCDTDMRQRSTYVHDAGQEFRPSELLVTDSQLLHGGLNAAREERLTYSFTELPEELQEVLGRTHELHVRWTPENNYNTATPFLARTLTWTSRLLYSPRRTFR